MNIHNSIIAAFFFTVLFAHSAIGQSTANDTFDEKVNRSSVAGAKMGSLVCENSDGERVLCSGSFDETILGIVTNLPYVTLNKPSSPDKSRYVFDALVDASYGKVESGTYLNAGKNGVLVPVSDSSKAYCVALEPASGSEAMVKVKVLK